MSTVLKEADVCVGEKYLQIKEMFGLVAALRVVNRLGDSRNSIEGCNLGLLIETIESFDVSDSVGSLDDPGLLTEKSDGYRSARSGKDCSPDRSRRDQDTQDLIAFKHALRRNRRAASRWQGKSQTD